MALLALAPSLWDLIGVVGGITLVSSGSVGRRRPAQVGFESSIVGKPEPPLAG